MFVIQRVLESDGSFTLLDKNKVLRQNKFFRLFATTNTVGLGDTSALYPGTQQINQGQMDRWNIVTTLNYLDFDKELEIVLAKNNTTIGIGSGQPSRLDSCKIAIEKMNKFQNIIENDEVVAASDAFFPFVDGIEKLVQAGVTAIIQPAGSIKDKEIIKFANRTGISLIFSKTRHFRH